MGVAVHENYTMPWWLHQIGHGVRAGDHALTLDKYTPTCYNIGRHVGEATHSFWPDTTRLRVIMQEQTMSNYNLDELIARWEHEKVTTEQVVGQVLLLLRSLAERVEELERWRRRQEKGEAQVQHKRG
jgi:hypothetical protein